MSYKLANSSGAVSQNDPSPLRSERTSARDNEKRSEVTSEPVIRRSRRAPNEQLNALLPF